MDINIEGTELTGDVSLVTRDSVDSDGCPVVDCGIQVHLRHGEITFWYSSSDDTAIHAIAAVMQYALEWLALTDRTG